jgi:hypothetical protein
MTKIALPDVPPPGAGLTTVTATVPAFATSLAEMDAVNCVLLTNLVVRVEPFHCTAETETKFEPFTVKVKAAPPAVALDGDIELIEGTGLFELPPDVMVNVSALEVTPDGLCTWIVNDPGLATALAESNTVIWVLLMYVMGQGPEKQKVLETIFPETSTLVPETRFVPFSVMVTAAPAGTVEGESELSVGTELCASACVLASDARMAAWINGSRIARIPIKRITEKSRSPLSNEMPVNTKNSLVGSLTGLV